MPMGTAAGRAESEESAGRAGAVWNQDFCGGDRETAGELL